MLGGLAATINNQWMHVDLLAIQPQARGRGIGQQLLAEAETLARARGLVGIWLDTHGFQAPEYYPRLGLRRVRPDRGPAAGAHASLLPEAARTHDGRAARWRRSRSGRRKASPTGTAVLALLHRAFAFMEGRIDPPSSLHRLDAAGLAAKAAGRAVLPGLSRRAAGRLRLLRAAGGLPLYRQAGGRAGAAGSGDRPGADGARRGRGARARAAGAGARRRASSWSRTMRPSRAGVCEDGRDGASGFRPADQHHDAQRAGVNGERHGCGGGSAGGETSLARPPARTGTGGVILHLALLLLFQLAGEIVSRLWAPMIPGPVLGLALFAVVLIVSPRLLAAVRPTLAEFLRHLSLLFVPAGVGVTVQLDRWRGRGGRHRRGAGRLDGGRDRGRRAGLPRGGAADRGRRWVSSPASGSISPRRRCCG